MLLLTAAEEARPQPGPLLLPRFEVRDTRGGAYRAVEATSTTRISIPLHELAQSVSVVTRELMDDTQGLRVLDVARFVTPIIESVPVAGDSYSVRGFRTQGKFVDGVSIGPIANSMWSDQSNFERLEIIKGPNAILTPGALPGGIINFVTKSPRFENFSRLSLSVRSYLGSGASLDANRTMRSGRSAVRLVVTRWDSDGYFQGQFRRGWLLAPSFTHRFAGGSELIIKAETLENRESNGMGVVIDPAVGTSVGGHARKHPLLPRDNLFPPRDSHRYRRETRVSAEYRFDLAGDVAARLWVMFDRVAYATPAPLGEYAGGLQGAVHPLTGEWVPFRSFSYQPATGEVAATQLTPSVSTFFTRRNQQNFRLEFSELHLKHDYASEYGLGRAGRGTTVGGVTANAQLGVKQQNWRVLRGELDYATGRPVGADEPTAVALAREKEARQFDAQAFLYQRLNLWSERLILSGGGAVSHGVLERVDDGNLPPPTGRRITRNTVVNVNAGVIFKPAPPVSLFTGYNRVGGGLPTSLTAGEYGTHSFKVGVGHQWEYGMKVRSRNERMSASVAYFRLFQGRSQISNPRFQANPATEPPFLYVDRRNAGWEIEGAAQVAGGLELVGNLTLMRMREENGLPPVMVPDHAGALFIKYTFRGGRWAGLGGSLGLHYQDAMPGETAAGVTAAGVPIQPSFYLASRTVSQAGLHYRRERWNVGVIVHNLANRDYIQASNSRNLLLPGEPRHYSATLEVTW